MNRTTFLIAIGCLLITFFLGGAVMRQYGRPTEQTVIQELTSILEMMGSLASSMTKISKAELEILREVRRIPRWCHDVESGLWRMVKTEEVICKEGDYHSDVRRSLQ